MKKDFRITMEEELFNGLTNLAKIKGISRNELALQQLEKIYNGLKNKEEIDLNVLIVRCEEVREVMQGVKKELNKNGVLLNQNFQKLLTIEKKIKEIENNFFYDIKKLIEKVENKEINVIYLIEKLETEIQKRLEITKDKIEIEETYNTIKEQYIDILVEFSDVIKKKKK